MNRLDKLTVINDDLKAAMEALSEPWVWLVLTEFWCGDAAQLVSVIHRIAKLSSKVKLRVLLRHKDLDVMNTYLTNGSKSIPKLICLYASDAAKPVFRRTRYVGTAPGGSAGVGN